MSEKRETGGDEGGSPRTPADMGANPRSPAWVEMQREWMDGSSVRGVHPRECVLWCAP